jgi:hypothetical protein
MVFFRVFSWFGGVLMRKMAFLRCFGLEMIEKSAKLGGFTYENGFFWSLGGLFTYKNG